jgi:hypothetical protein
LAPIQKPARCPDLSGRQQMSPLAPQVTFSLTKKARRTKRRLL